MEPILKSLWNLIGNTNIFESNVRTSWSEYKTKWWLSLLDLTYLKIKAEEKEVGVFSCDADNNEIVGEFMNKTLLFHRNQRKNNACARAHVIYRK